MRYILSLCIVLFISSQTQAQHSIRLSIKSKDEKQPLTGATLTIDSLHKTVISDSLGMATFKSIASGTYTIKVSFIGFQELEISIKVPQDDNTITEVFLEEGGEHEEEEVVITTTRTSRTISDIPTRVETISGEELSEKGNMKPGEIRMLLSESTGIQTQQTSATSYSSSIRIQGLDGRYTQLLRDGFPLYSGFAGGLSIMQIAPLDLRQVEVIKGSSSTLYGGGAIAGLVNLVSKVPTTKRELSFMGNLTSAGGTDLSGFYSQKFNKIGLTVFGSRNTGKAYDPADIGLTAIPEFVRYTINPRLFIYGDKTTANIGLSFVTEDRVGGSMDYIENGKSGYFEKNNTDRFTLQAQLTHQINDHSQLNFKTSYNRFYRTIQIPAYVFEGLQQSSYSEATYSINKEKTDWIAGLNFWTDDFKEEKHSDDSLRDYHYNTFGAFIQNNWTPTKNFSLETGLRADHVKQYGFELLPRISAMFKLSSKLTARLGGGLGYKTPTVFNEESEKMQFQNILPINENTANDEQSVGGNFDLNYRARLGDVGISINQLFFYTKLNSPLVLTTAGNGDYEFLNANGHIDTKGTETNLRITYSDFKLFLGYTYANVNTHYNDVKSWYPLSAKHRLNNVLMYEKEGKLKIGLEAYYFSPQLLSDGATGKSYWIFGMMAEKSWEWISVFINLENFTDTRQTKFDTIFTGSIDNPTFLDIYAPVDGFVVNGGVKIRL
jgi:outer membrane receptor for ferrienterochelin and colicins